MAALMREACGDHGVCPALFSVWVLLLASSPGLAGAACAELEEELVDELVSFCPAGCLSAGVSGW